nr:unnamed protein product [Callosobruchus analis]
MNDSDEPNIDADVIIIGAGLAGLTAAYKILSREPSLNVLILESTKNVGGRYRTIKMLTKNNRTSSFEVASQWINKDQVELLDLLEELDIPFVSTVIQGSVIKEWNGTEICKHRLGMLSGLSLSEQLELAHFLVKVETHRYNLEKNWDKATIRNLASITFQDFIDENLSSDNVKCFIEYVVLINCAIPPDKISAFFYIFYCISNRSLVDQMVSEKGTNRYRIKVSSGRTSFVFIKHTRKNICERLAEKIDPNIIFFGEPVLKIGVSTKFVKVVTIYDRLYCHALIAAIPPSDLMKIKFKPSLPLSIVDSICNTISRNVTTFIATYQEGFTGEIYAFDRNCSEGPIVICSGLTPEKPALVGRLYGGKPTSDELKTYFGKEALHPLDYYEKTWRQHECLMPVWEVNNCEYIDCFRLPSGSYFFDEDLLKTIVEQSNLFSVQSAPNHPVCLQETDVKRYIGICVLMSVIHMPNMRSYWSNTIGTEIIKNTMSQKQFEIIKRNPHFNDNSQMLPKEHTMHDRLYKIRPISDHLLNRYQSVPYEACLSIDEQKCLTKTKSYLKQYMPAKPHKWGFKVYVMAGISGYSYNLEIYSGQENKTGQNKNDLGACANIVTRLLCNLPSHLNYHVYFDNYYTTLPLLAQLSQRGVQALGTVRRNRIPKCPLPGDKEMKNKSRGSSKEYVTELDGVPISSVIWKDNKTVCLASTFCGTLPKGKAERYDKSQNKRIEIECPKIVKEYNKHMGGVDLMDSLIGRYRIKLKSRKRYIRLFYHLLDMTIVNAWLLYRRVNALQGNAKTLNLANFRIELAETLCKMGVHQNSRGRRSELEKQIQAKQRSHHSS